MYKCFKLFTSKLCNQPYVIAITYIDVRTMIIHFNFEIVLLLLVTKLNKKHKNKEIPKEIKRVSLIECLNE